MSEPVFRKAKKEDLFAITDIAARATEKMLRLGIRQWDGTYPLFSDFEADIAEETLFVGTLDEKVVVYYALNDSSDETYQLVSWRCPERKYKVMHRFIVDPDFQGRGIAKKALKDLEERLKSWGVHAVRLEAYSHNPISLGLYSAFGYRAAGEVVFSDGREFTLMEKYF